MCLVFYWPFKIIDKQTMSMRRLCTIQHVLDHTKVKYMLLFFCEVVLVCRPCIAGADEKVWAEKVFGRSWVLYDGLRFFEESRDKISLGEIPLHFII